MATAPTRVDELKKRYEENPRRFFAPLANEYRKAGDLDAAIDLCRMHLEEQPGHLSGHIVYGQALYESSRPDEARQVFEAALTLDPENLIALRHLGDIARVAGDAPAATHWYQRVLDADPRNDEVIALIETLKPAAASPLVGAPADVPTPPPGYGREEHGVSLAEAAVFEDSSPVGVGSTAASEAAPAAPVSAAPPDGRSSIGLMDLDLNLADSTAPAVDLLGVAPLSELAPSEPLSSEPPPSAPPPPIPVEIAPPSITDAVPALDLEEQAAPAEVTASQDEIVSVGSEEVAAAAAASGEPLAEVLDTSFGAPPPEEEPTFPEVTEEPVAEVAVPPSPFVTETMAELYLQQGFRVEALGVYRQLLELNPGNESLADRVRQLEQEPPLPSAAEGVSERPEEAAVEEEPAPARVPVAPSGPTAREVFARIAARRAAPSGGEASPASEDVSDAGVGSLEATEAATASGALAVQAGGIDQLFGNSGVVAEDEGAAVALSAAFGASAESPVLGQPTRAGTDELSLDSVFREDAGAAHSAGVQRQSTKLRFDQFFAGEGDAANPSPSAVQDAPPSRDAGGDEDVAQFSNWLKGLKDT